MLARYKPYIAWRFQNKSLYLEERPVVAELFT